MTAIAEPLPSPREWTKSDLNRYVGGLSTPSKMPGLSYSLPAAECNVGSKLRVVAGSTCSKCYALKGRYSFPVVRSALYRRLESLDLPLWVDVMVELINRHESEYFRWHDSGDLQSLEHLAKIVEVCNGTPGVRHWLPTREYKLIQDYLHQGGEVPPNLNIRLSAHMIDGTAPAIGGLTTSTVSSNGHEMPGAHICPAPTQDNKCGDCRACWDRGTAIVDYHLH